MTFQSNLERLTTPFDVHETLEDILYLQQHATTKKQQQSRAISLFNKVPEQRSCSDAFIEPLVQKKNLFYRFSHLPTLLSVIGVHVCRGVISTILLLKKLFELLKLSWRQLISSQGIIVIFATNFVLNILSGQAS